MFRVSNFSLFILMVTLIPVLVYAQPPKPVIEDVYTTPDDYPYHVGVSYRVMVLEGESLINCLTLWRRQLDIGEVVAEIVRRHCYEEPVAIVQGHLHGYSADESYDLKDVFEHGSRYEFQLWAADEQGRVTVSDPYVFRMPWDAGMSNEFADWLYDLEERIEIIEDRLGIVVD